MESSPHNYFSILFQLPPFDLFQVGKVVPTLSRNYTKKIDGSSSLEN